MRTVNHKSHERREAHERFLRLLCIFYSYLWFIADTNGHEAGHLLYDAYGGVLESTFTAPDLATALAGQGALADPATGLVHLGNCRFYDPELGRPLQPNPAGGPPTVPQSLNRYAATAVGAPGVVEGAGQQSALYGAGSVALQGIVGGAAGKGLELGLKQAGQALDVGYLRVNPWRLYQLKNAGYRHLFTYERQGWYISEAIQPVGDDVLGVVGRSERIALSRLRSIRGLEMQLDWPITAKAGKWLRGLGGGFLAGSVAELALSLPDFVEPWRNPYFNNTQRVAQKFVTFGGALAGTGVGIWVGNAAAMASLGGPVTFVAVTASGVVVFVAWEGLIKPGVSWVFPKVGLRDPYQEYRNLKPLGGGQ